MSSIQSRPGTDFELAMHALKWMLVSRKPLHPRELVAATEVDPSSTPLDHTVPDSSLDVELVIHVCGGLILLDYELDVMRFAHLSVQEYLETRKNSCSTIDAQRFVSEGCLWTLRYGSPIAPLYDYAGRNWFRYCKSYQDIALSQSTQDPNHALDIPILNTFLGTFDCPSTHFVQWVSWLKEAEIYGDLYLCILVPSEPLSPAFAAALWGLGELVSWLWDSEGTNMNIKNSWGHSLLYLASRYGTTWIMKCILARGADLDINDVCNSVTALWGAAYPGTLENAALLLDCGADANLRLDAPYGTALNAAVGEGMLDMATLLLDRGADINLTSGGYYGTALGIAAACGPL